MNNISMKIKSFTQKRIMQLFGSNAALAQLRRGIGKELGDIPGLLEYVLPPEEITMYKKSEKCIERAIYTALTLYAWHQQGHKEQCMSGEENPFGRAVQKLVHSDKANEIAVVRRFNKVLTAKDVTEISVHARGLIGLLKKENISVNYPDFAVDLYWFQQEEYRRNVLLKWGKDFYMNAGKDDK